MLGLLQELLEGRNQQPSAACANRDKVDHTARLCADHTDLFQCLVTTVC